MTATQDTQKQKKTRPTKQEKYVAKMKILEKQEHRIVAQKAILKKGLRKIRDGQLILLGIYVEDSYKKTTDDGRKKIETAFLNLFEGYNLERAKATILRLQGEVENEKEKRRREEFDKNDKQRRANGEKPDEKQSGL